MANGGKGPAAVAGGVSALLTRLLGSLRRQAEADRIRWVLWLPVALGAGVGLYFALPAEPDWAWTSCAAVLAVILCICSLMIPHGGLRMILALLTAFSLGFTVAKLRTEAVAAPVLTRQIGPVGLTGRIDFVQQHGKGARLLLSHLLLRRLPPESTPAAVRVSVRSQADRLMPGQWVRLTVVLMPPPGPAAPGGYDFGREAYYQRIGGVGYAYGGAKPIKPVTVAGWGDRLALAIDTLRWRITQRIQAVLPGSTGGIASALITGDRGAISQEDEQALRDAGLAHVLAIAGLHMALVGLGLFWTARALLAFVPALALRFPIKKWAALAALASATFYLIISGAATPATRAYIMLVAMLVAILFDRPALSMRSVAFAAAIILLLRPENIFEPGFQMSFSAVGSLVAVAEWEQKRRMRRTDEHGPRRFAGLRRYVRGIATTSLVGSLATAPFAVFHFDRATHYAVIGNLLAMPVMGFVAMPAAAISIMLMPFGLDAWPLRVLGWGIDAMLGVGRLVSGLPGAVSIISAWPIAMLALLSLGGLWLLVWRRPWRYAGVAPMALAVGLAIATPGPDLLVSRDGRTVAVRGGDGLLRFVRPPRDDYSAGEWLKRDGDERLWKAAVATADDGVRCDSLGCLARARGGTLVAVDERAEALAEDCANAAIVVSMVPARRLCVGPKLVIDGIGAARVGGYAVWLGDNIRIQTVEGERGLRPWSMRQSLSYRHGRL